MQAIPGGVVLCISCKHESNNDLHPVTMQAAVHLAWLAQKDEQRRRHEAKAAMKKNRRLPQWYLHTAALRPRIDSQDFAAWSVLVLSHTSDCLATWSFLIVSTPGTLSTCELQLCTLTLSSPHFTDQCLTMMSEHSLPGEIFTGETVV